MGELRFDLGVWRSRLAARPSWALGLGFSGLYLLYLLIHRLRNGGTHPFATGFEDDFFYYVVIGRNLLAGHGSTFDQVVSTNGYQPLWMGVVVAAEAVFGSGQALLWAMSLLAFALVAAGVVLMGRYLERAARDETYSPGFVAPASLFYGAAGLAIAMRGMEVALLWPLLPLLLLTLRALAVEPSPRRYGQAGLVLALIGLARLDCAVFLLPLCGWTAVLILRRSGLKAALRQAPLAMAAGLSPLLVYLASNLVLFGDVVPLSGLAKRLLIVKGPFLPQGLIRFREALGSAVILGLAAPAALGVAATLARRDRPAVLDVVYLPVALGCLIYYASNLAFSDWILWSWYYFALAFTAALSIGLVAPAFARGGAPALVSRFMHGSAWLIIVGLVVMTGLSRLDDSMLDAGLALRDFASAHPGRYAMGDRAGMASWAMGQGLVQLEGLVSDRRMLEDIRNQAPLAEVLKRRGIDYYISTDAVPAEGCFETLEPAEPGPAAPKMAGRFCTPPVLIIRAWSVFQHRPVVTRVFAVGTTG